MICPFPFFVKTSLNQLTQAGFLAFVVGGAVRDMLLSRQVLDYDIATNASPTQVKSLFAKTLSHGEKYGTITVVTEEGNIEITTFRKDGAYQDKRHTEEVFFIGDLPGDLKRRDFTINAMAMDSKGNLMDPFHGKKDLEAGIIRTVGEPAQRFSEDALRIFRGLRFAAKLGFSIEENTWVAMTKQAHLVKNLSRERIASEIKQILCSPRPMVMEQVLQLGLLDGFLEGDAPFTPPSLVALETLPSQFPVRFIGFLYLTKLSENLSLNLGFDKKTTGLIGKSLRLLHQGVATEKVGLKRQLAEYGLEAVETAITVEAVFLGKQTKLVLKEILQQKEPFLYAHLAIKGDDLKKLGIAPGKEMGALLESLLQHVISHPQDNDKQCLLDFLEKGKD